MDNKNNGYFSPANFYVFPKWGGLSSSPFETLLWALRIMALYCNKNYEDSPTAAAQLVYHCNPALMELQSHNLHIFPPLPAGGQHDTAPALSRTISNYLHEFSPASNKICVHTVGQRYIASE